MNYNSWQSVENAVPDNNEPVLAYSKNYGLQVCCYVEKHSMNISEMDMEDDDSLTDYDAENDQYYMAQGWYKVGPTRGYDDYWFQLSDITHWRPLPDKP